MMGFDIPWYVWFLFGFLIGGLAFNRKLRQQADSALGRVMGKKTKRHKPTRHEEDEDEDYHEEDNRHNGRRVYTFRPRRGTVIREIHFHDDD